MPSDVSSADEELFGFGRQRSHLASFGSVRTSIAVDDSRTQAYLERR